ncbi:MAG: radical SAM protein [Deltaproteobacteria bacterium]|nr:MAG: radical SAM protein [Deltaproteobacteria bacterium]
MVGPVHTAQRAPAGALSSPADAPNAPAGAQLILTVTRACNLRCAYCPTAKDGWPSLTVDDARRAVALFAERYGGGDIKLFGGEPLLVPEVVRAAMDEARARPEIRRVYLSTNGLGLDADWIAYVRGHEKAILTLSLDGRPEDHRALRRALPGVADSYAHVVSLLPELTRLPRLVVTQTIAPKTAARAADNFRHLRELGFWRFNFLPGYYVPWRDEQLTALSESFVAIANDIRNSWERGERLYVRNLFTRAPTPFFNTGLVVDADRTIHPSNVGLSGSLEELLDQTQVGTLDDPPTPEALAERAAAVNALLEARLPERVWASTMAADLALTRFCEALYPAYFAQRERRARRRTAAGGAR